MPMPLMLASASPTRAEMLRRAGVAIEVRPARIDEEALKESLAQENATPREIADALAEQKARKVSARFDGKLVLGADQILDFDGAALSKPATRDEAHAQLDKLRGKDHRLFSAAVLARDGVPVWRAIDTVRLTMRAISDTYMGDYIDRNWPDISGSVGGYRIEEEGVRLFSNIEGSHFAILGLPLLPLLTHLAMIGEIQA